MRSSRAEDMRDKQKNRKGYIIENGGGIESGGKMGVSEFSRGSNVDVLCRGCGCRGRQCSGRVDVK